MLLPNPTPPPPQKALYNIHVFSIWPSPLDSSHTHFPFIFAPSQSPSALHTYPTPNPPRPTLPCFPSLCTYQPPSLDLSLGPTSLSASLRPFPMPSPLLKVPSGQIGSAWEWYNWIGLEKDIFKFWSWIFENTSKFWAANTKMHLILLLVGITGCMVTNRNLFRQTGLQ